MKQFEPNTKPCYSENQNNRESRKAETRQRLSLTNLMGAFAVLAVGYLLSFLIFLAEMAISHLKTNIVIVM
jgi:ionotropic glutamate receptor